MMSEDISRQQLFFNTCLDVYQSACSDIETRYFRTGPFVLKLEFANPSLVPVITPALNHISSEPVENPDLTIYLWDSVSTGTDMVPSPWTVESIMTYGKIRGFNSDAFQTSVSLISGALSMLDVCGNKGFWWIKDAGSVCMPEKGAPLLALFDWWLSRKGIYYIHSGAVGTENGGALIMGKGHAGKSTTSIGCITSSLKYMSDDYCLLTQNPESCALSIYNSGKIDDGSVRRLSHLSFNDESTIKVRGEKSLVFVNEDYPENIVRQFPVKAVILPEISHNSSGIKQISPGDAFKVIAPNNLFQFTGEKKGAFKAFSDLVRKVPCYKLFLSSHPLKNAGYIEQVI